MAFVKLNKKAKIASIAALMLAMVVLAMFVLGNHRKCSNGLDDDNDGLVDYPADPGCSSRNDNSETGTAVCDNGRDETNDADALADFRLSNGDPGCTSATDNNERDGQCDDKLDNDGDTKKDYNLTNGDPGCTSYGDASELGVTQCDDGLDNDGDAKSDYGLNSLKDSKCTSPDDNDETPRDSCTDSDGGYNRDVVGTVSGDDDDVPFSFTDVCYNSTAVQEYYCGTLSQDYAPKSLLWGCGGNTTTCVDGRCV